MGHSRSCWYGPIPSGCGSPVNGLEGIFGALLICDACCVPRREFTMTMATRGVRRRAADCPSSEQGPCPVPLRQTPSCYAFQTPRPVHQGTRTCRHAAPELHRSEDPRPVIRSAAPKKCRKPLPALRSLDCRRTQRELQAQSLGISECLQMMPPCAAPAARATSTRL